ncbi:MAG: response regulator transcription factor [Bacteroidota bacterium]|jgi:two-component system response regulator VicR
MHKLLLVEDEDMLSMIIKDTLETKGFEVMIARNGAEALVSYKKFLPDIAVLDIMMEGMSGYEVASEIRKQNEFIPLLFLSAKSQTADVLKGFEAGANDYMKKPFSIDELLARIQVLLRTITRASGKTRYQIGNYVFDAVAQTLLFGNDSVTISFKEAKLLQFLSENINQVVEKERVLEEIWGMNTVYTSRNMDVVITKLRRYFKNDERIKFINLRGVGYKLVVE